MKKFCSIKVLSGKLHFYSDGINFIKREETQYESIKAYEIAKILYNYKYVEELERFYLQFKDAFTIEERFSIGFLVFHTSM